MDARAELRAAVDAGVFEGVRFKVLDRPIPAGDTYLAARNTGPHLLTAGQVVPYPTEENGLMYGGWVVPLEWAYAFDLGECVPIKLEI